MKTIYMKSVLIVMMAMVSLTSFGYKSDYVRGESDKVKNWLVMAAKSGLY